MKNSIILFCCLFIASQCLAQISYFEKYDNLGDGGEAVTNLLKLNDDEGFIISTGEVNAIDEGWHMIMRRIDFNDGKVLSKIDYSPKLNHIVSPYEIIENISGNYITTGSIVNRLDSIPFGGDVFICEVTSDGEVLWSNSIGTYPEKERGDDVIQVNDGYIIAGNKKRQQSGSILDAIILKTNTQGDSLWTTIIADTDGASSWKAKVIENGLDNTCFVGINRTNDTEPWFDVARIDANDGAILWKKQYMIGLSNGLQGSALSEGGELVISGTVSAEGGNCSSWFLTKIDADGNVKWSYDYEEEVGCAFGNKIIRTNDGGYATCLRQSRPVLAVTDSKGNFLYSKTYDIEPYMSPVDLIQLEDGSFIIVGYEGATNDYTTWLIRTDPEGNLVVSVGQEIEKIPIRIYPNPSTDYINIDLPKNSTKPYTARLANSAGVVIATYDNAQLNSSISVENLPTGMYYINIFEEEQLVAIKKIVKQ